MLKCICTDRDPRVGWCVGLDLSSGRCRGPKHGSGSWGQRRRTPQDKRLMCCTCAAYKGNADVRG